MPDTNWPADLLRRESEQSGEPARDLAATEAARGEAAWTKLCELADRAGDHWLAFDIKKAACEYGIAREKHAIETLAAKWRESVGSAANA